MSLLSQLSSLALDALDGADDYIKTSNVVALGGGAVKLVLQRFVDHSARLPRALERSAGRAWRAVEVALAGPSWWERCKRLLATADERAIRAQVEAYLAAHPLDGVDGHGPNFRDQCLAQLHAARKAGLLHGGDIDPQEVARRVGDLARFGEPAARVEAHYRAVGEIAERLRWHGYAALATFLTLRPAGGPPLLFAAVRFFFRREVERDQELFQGLAHARLEGLAEGQSSGFAALAEALDSHGDRLEALLVEVQAVVVQTHADVLDVKAELARQGQQMQEIGRAVLQALEQRQLSRRELGPGDSLSVRDEDERRLVRDLVRRYRALPADERRRMPALLNAMGKLQVVAGDFDEAGRDFREVAALVDGPARAEAAFNAYRVALERREWDEALRSLKEAMHAEPARFAPFPVDKFEAERILGAGGFGVAVLCRNRHSGGRVVIKSLRRDGLERDLGEVFREAQSLEELDHPAIIRIRDCDYADAARTRAFLVMDYFAGPTLGEYVDKSGPLSVGDLLPLARLVAEGLARAHGKGILHRDIKPANLLVRRAGGRWEAKLIDFGLALRAKATGSTFRSSMDRTIAGASLAGTIEYAAPEQMGRLKGVAVGPYSDVYGFGKTCCFALFGTPQPTFQHWGRLPRELAELLGRCLDEQPRNRPQGFGEVLRELDRITLGPPKAAPPAVIAEALPVVDAEPAPVAKVREVPVGREAPRTRARELPEPPAEARPARERAEEKPQSSLAGCFIVALLLGVTLAAGAALLAFFGINRPGGGRPPVTTPTGPPGLAVPVAYRPVSEAEFPNLLAEMEAKGVTTERRREIAARLAVTDVSAKQKQARAEVVRLGDLVAKRAGSHREYEEAWAKDEVGRVARALNPLLSDTAESKKAAAQALQKWGTADNVDLLIPILAGNEAGVFDLRIEAAKALAAIGDVRGIRPVAKRLEDSWDSNRGIVEVLCSFADKKAVEEVMIDLVRAGTKEKPTRQEVDAADRACAVLEKIGTSRSLPALAGATAGKGQATRLRLSAGNAAKAIGGRATGKP